jgi:hypothetical protein
MPSAVSTSRISGYTAVASWLWINFPRESLAAALQKAAERHLVSKDVIPALDERHRKMPGG